jgi:DNA-binding response OmpR family regulator
MANVLFIEPDAVLARIYTQALTHDGHHVRHATGAQQAIDLADVACPDLIVLEPLLVGHSGIGFLHELRSYSEWKHIPAILHTRLSPEALTGMKDALRHDLGVPTILYKPKTTLRQLLRAVNQSGSRS